MITQEELKKLFSYNGETGELVPIKPRNGKVSKGKPNSNGYHVIMIKRKKYYAHRLVWLYVYGHFPPEDMVIDHIDRDRNNNRINNLRLATRTENTLNSKICSNNKTGHKGVTFISSSGKYWAYIYHKGKQYSLKYHDTYEQAVQARQKAEALRDSGQLSASSDFT